MFDEIPQAQWAVYAHLIAQDRIEEAEDSRGKIEYMARFINNKAVEEIHRMRKLQEQSAGMPDDAFNVLLKQRFGRGVGSFGPPELSVKELGRQIK